MSEQQRSERYRGPVALHHEQTVAVVTHNGPGDTIDWCRLILAESNDQFDKHQLLQHLATKMPVDPVSFQTMLSVVQVCQDIQTVTQPLQPVNESSNASDHSTVNYWTLAKGILPGTLWCGVDDIAGNYSSLGPEWQLDKCCRAHDHCPVKVKSFKTRYGVFNFGPYTKSHCACDKQFYDCLKTVNSEKSEAVGDFFFNVLGVQCVEKRVKRRCVKTTQLEKYSSEYGKKDKNIAEASEKIFNIGLASDIKNTSKCLAWKNYPLETAQFVIADAKEKF